MLEFKVLVDAKDEEIPFLKHLLKGALRHKYVSAVLVTQENPKPISWFETVEKEEVAAGRLDI